MIGRLFCRHLDTYRERIDGVPHFVCACGYRVPVLRREPDEIVIVTPPAHERLTVQRKRQLRRAM